MSEIGNQILTRFDKVKTVLGEAFPWKAHELFLDVIVDGNGEKVADVWGYFGHKDPVSPGTAERRRMIQEAPAMLMLLRDLRNCGVVDPIRAAKILDRIEGRTT